MHKQKTTYKEPWLLIGSLMIWVLCIQCLFDVGNDVVGILDTYRETDKVGTYAGFNQLFVAKLAVCVAGRMQYAGACIGHVSNDGSQFQ